MLVSHVYDKSMSYVVDCVSCPGENSSFLGSWGEGYLPRSHTQPTNPPHPETQTTTTRPKLTVTSQPTPSGTHPPLTCAFLLDPLATRRSAPHPNRVPCIKPNGMERLSFLPVLHPSLSFKDILDPPRRPTCLQLPVPLAFPLSHDLCSLKISTCGRSSSAPPLSHALRITNPISIPLHT